MQQKGSGKQKGGKGASTERELRMRLEKVTEDLTWHKKKLQGAQERIEFVEARLGEAQKEKNKVLHELKAAAMRIRELESAPTTTQEDLVEIVAVPPKDKSTGKMIHVKPMYINGIRVREETIDGFQHFWLPQSRAERFLADTTAMRFLLVGPMDSLTIKVRRGLYSETITVNRHELSHLSNESRWIPVHTE